MKSSAQDEKFSKIKSKCCALKKNIFAILLDITFSGVQLTLPFLYDRSHCDSVFENGW